MLTCMKECWRINKWRRVIRNNIINHQGTPLILGHRGSLIRDRFPENTIPSFREALELGADGFELDLLLSRDLQLMVFHDSTLKRLLGIKKSICLLNSEDISRFTFLNEPENAQTRIPHLEDLFEEFGSSVYYNLEIKSPSISFPHIFYFHRLVKLLKEQIDRFGLSDKVWISSFDPSALRLWHQSDQVVPAAFLFEKWNPVIRYIAGRHYIQALHPAVHLGDDIADIKKIGKPLCFWTVNMENSLEEELARDAFAVITDNLPRVISVLRK